jgi:signal transduction histidine kinase
MRRMKEQEKEGRIRHTPLRRSVQMKFAASYLALIISVLLLLNIYPVFTSQDLVFKTKQTSMQSQAAVIASTVASLEELTQDNVTQVMEMLDESGITRVMVTDPDGLILYDSEGTSTTPQYALIQEISRALGGKDVFTSTYHDGAFRSTAAVPVQYRNSVIGAIYLYEYDNEQGGIIVGLRQNLFRISVILLGLAILLSLLLARTMTRRISQMTAGISKWADGAYDTRLKVAGQDELTELASTFNELTERLEKTDEVRKRFVSDASHELKTPLASIKLLTDSINQNPDMDEETIRDFVSDIGMEADRLTRITEKLLALTRMDNGSVAPRAPVNLKNVAEDALHMLAPLASEGEISIYPALAEDCVILSSADEMYQVLFNLVENGLKYNAHGGMVWVTLHQELDQAVLTVADTGIGIPDEDKAKIFDRFYRVDKARSREAGGTGLGLSIVRDTVVSNGGTIEVTDRPEGGTVFTVHFPLQKEEEAQA